ncbi:MAG TPA: TonB-dependent receptor [Rhodocyclaceae bacterium]|nr:TonB-dependent receptor [Rhodocyclaceae bacterium]
MKNYRYRVLVLAMAALQQSSPLWALSPDEEELALIYSDKFIVSIAAGSAQPLRRAPAVATVITAEDIAAMGATNIDEVLETVPGMHINRAASMNATNYVMRGVVSLYTPQVLMLQNGIPVTVMLTGNKGSLWGGLPMENIARIEVIRGPGSALYGADAYSGVVNVITKTAADAPGTQLGVRAGSFSTADMWAQHGGKLGALDVAAYLRLGSTDGFNSTLEADARSASKITLAPGPVNTGLDAVDGGLDLAYGAWRWRVGYKLRDDMGTYAGLASALDPVGRGKSERITTDLSWSNPKLTDHWGATVDLAYMHYEQTFPTLAQLFPPGTTFLPTRTFTNGMIGAPEFADKQARLSASATYSGFADHRLRIGFGHDDLNMYKTREYMNFAYDAKTGAPVPIGATIDSPIRYIAPHERKVNYAYIQDEWNFIRDWTLTAGIRRDNYSDVGGTTNPRLALVWDAAQNLTAKFLYGKAFRAPAFTELYSSSNPIGQGNPNIKPETNSTLEAAVAWQASQNLLVNLNVFRYDMKAIIRTLPNPAPAIGSTYNNTGTQNGKGFELEATWDVSRSLRLTGHYAYQRSFDGSTYKDAGYAPHNHIYARGDWRFNGNWLATAQVNWVADRMRAAGDNRPALADYKTLDLTLRSQRGNKHWDFAASIRNLFNTNVREPSLAPGTALPNDLPLARRSVYLQAVYSL